VDDRVHATAVPLGLLRPTHSFFFAFDGERFGNDGDGQRAEFDSERSNQWRRLVPVLPLKPVVMKLYPRLQNVNYFFGVFDGAFAPDFDSSPRRVRASVRCRVEFYRRVRIVFGLQIGVHHDKVNFF